MTFDIQLLLFKMLMLLYMFFIHKLKYSSLMLLIAHRYAFCFSSIITWQKLVPQALSSQDRKKILLGVADALEANEKLIKIENEADVAAAQQAGLEKSLISRLALKPGKVRQLWIVYLFMFFLLPLPTFWFLSCFIFHLAK